MGMGGQLGGMTNEARHFPEVCKKSVQAQAGDMAGTIGEEFFRTMPLVSLERLGSRELEGLGRLAFPILAGPGDTHFRRVSWSEAPARPAAELRTTRPGRTFFRSSGRPTHARAVRLQLPSRAC